MRKGQAIKIVPLFFKAARDHGGLGLTTSEIGIVYGTFGAAAFVLGSIIAGYFTAGRGLRKSLFILCCFFNMPFVVYAFLAIAMPTSLFVIGTAVVFEYFGYGFGFVGLDSLHDAADCAREDTRWPTTPSPPRS